MSEAPMWLRFNAKISETGGPFRVSITTTPLERTLLARGIVQVEELQEQYRIAIERGEYTTYGFA